MEERITAKYIGGVRHNDLPVYKDRVMSQLFGEFIGYLKSIGLTKGKEFETHVKEIFECSQKIIWIDELHPDIKINVILNSISMKIEFAVVVKKTTDVLHREKLEDLRYKISSCTEIELIDAHQKRFNEFFEIFKIQLNGILTHRKSV